MSQRGPHHTLDQLLVLEAISECGSFAGAARQLGRVPSAISHAVARLEEVLGVELFDRSGHRAVLSPAGRRVLEAGAQVLAAGRRLDALAAGLHGGWEPTLHVVADGALPTAPLLRALRRFLEEAPPTRVRLDVEFRQGVLDRFTRDDADLMLALGLEEAEGCATEPLPPLEMCVVVGARHPLAAGGPRARADLADHAELLVRDSSPAVEEGTEAWFGGPSRTVHLPDFPTKHTALLEGLGFGWMPLHLIENDLARGRLVALELVGEPSRWTWRPLLVRRADRPVGPAKARFSALLRDELGGCPGPAPAP
jgi:DNA-binding transcriptional LysR family regulator